MALSAGLLAAIAPSTATAVQSALVQATVKAGLAIAAGVGNVATVVSANVAALVKGFEKMLLLGRVKTIGLILALFAVIGPGAGILLYGTTSLGPFLAHAADQPVGKDAKEPERPVLVKVTPADGATDVDPITEIRLRFDRPMDRTSAFLRWNELRSDPPKVQPGAPVRWSDFASRAGFRLRGEMRYLPETHEFILPVQLAPGCKHEVTGNEESAFRKKEYKGFQSQDHVAAKVFHWSFSTKPTVEKKGTPPRATAVAPPSDTEVALITPLEVTFDQPMDPRFYGLGNSEQPGMAPMPQLLGKPRYDAERRRFTLLVRLPANWNGELHLVGFRDKDGVAARPIALKYRTLQAPLSEALRQRVEQAGRSAELRQLVERVRKARRDLKSVSEQVIAISTRGSTTPDWDQSFEMNGLRFEMQGNKFLGVVDQTFDTPFRIGSDGTTCWFRHGNERIAITSKEIEEKNVLICDPFKAAGDADAMRVIQDLKLEYLGEAQARGQRCHHVRSWDVTLPIHGHPTPVLDWWIDTTTLRPVRVETLGSGTHSLDYTYASVNKPIRDEDFKPESGPGIKWGQAEPFLEGYKQRFLNVNDGSAGRMSVRWGMRPKGTRSSGLN